MNRYVFIMLSSISVLFVLGLVMVFNTSSAQILDRFSDRSLYYALIRQLLYAAVSAIGVIAIWSVGYRSLLSLSPLLLFLGVIGLTLVLVFGPKLNGARRWISLFGNSLQPSEFVKYLIPLYYTYAVTKQKNSLDWVQFLRLLGIICIPLSLILIEPDNGTVAIILSVLIVLFILSQLTWVYWALPLMIICCIGGVVASQMPHVSNRLKVYLHPEYDLKGKGHQPYQARIAAGSGRLFGRGIGESLQKLEYLPEARCDYIAAIFAEECGFIGMSILIFLYTIVAFCGFAIALQVKEIGGFYLVASFTFLICFQAFLNLGIVSGLLPSKGTNLPFFSQGGSSLIANMLALTIIVKIAEEAKQQLKNDD
ncbi:MAG: FtsW/RodA/SpoVE family cell cycle protein [Candidatus Rhabdochlamydia sp.]|jgi:cell division protein FtsW